MQAATGAANAGCNKLNSTELHKSNCHNKEKNRMKMNEMFPSKYIAAIDLEDGDRTLVIKDVDFEEFQNEGRPERKPVIAFRGEKPMVLNKTNASIITHLYGDETEDWVGKSVTLYATEVESFGKTTLAIRIRNRVPNRESSNSEAQAREGRDNGNRSSDASRLRLTQEQRDQIIEQAGIAWPDQTTRKAEMQALLPCRLDELSTGQADQVLAAIKRIQTPTPPASAEEDFDDSDPFADDDPFGD